MMNNYSPTSDCQQAIRENVSQGMHQQQQQQQQEEPPRMEEEAVTKRTTITTNIESRKENADQEIITRMENVAASTNDKIINENSATSDSRSCQSQDEKKPSKDRAGTINLMQDAKESKKNLEKPRMKSDERKIWGNPSAPDRGGAKSSICWTILCRSRSELIPRKFSKRKSTSKKKKVAGSTFKRRKNPVPTKEWVWIYHRPLVRQNAFCDTWPEN